MPGLFFDLLERRHFHTFRENVRGIEKERIRISRKVKKQSARKPCYDAAWAEGKKEMSYDERRMEKIFNLNEMEMKEIAMLAQETALTGEQKKHII